MDGAAENAVPVVVVVVDAVVVVVVVVVGTDAAAASRLAIRVAEGLADDEDADLPPRLDAAGANLNAAVHAA